MLILVIERTSGILVIMITLMVAVIGICLGSFVNALVWRLHEQQELADKKPKNYKKKLQALSISKGRSMCPSCGHQLHAKDLVPILSWLSLQGKCRYCKKSISAQYPAVELLTGALFALSYEVWPYALEQPAAIGAFIVWLLLLVGFVAHSVYDVRWYMLLDRITLPLTVLGVVFVALQAYAAQDASVLAGAAIGAAVLAGIFFGLFQVSDGRWIGGGDVKIAPLLGLLAGGFLEVMLLLFAASSLGTLYAVLAAAITGKSLKAGTRIPFGPFLIAATVLTVLYGAVVISWYTGLLTTT